jgi:FtsZ-interacting cell division protein ZipA
MEPQMEQQKSSIGGIIGTIIIIALIILGGLYFWGKRIEESKAKQQVATDDTLLSQDQANEANVSSADDLNSIQADLNATSFDNLGTEMN